MTLNMAKTIRSPETATRNWVSRAGSASGFYKTQVQAASWKAAAASDNAEKNYATAVQAAVTNKSRQAGVSGSSDEAWKAGVSTVGETRYSAGVSASSPRMSAAMGKLIPAIQAIRDALPPRGVRGSQTNFDRAQILGKALATKRGTFKAKGVARTGT
jgi:hypothetical protein